jgi:hypothetical protein
MPRASSQYCFANFNCSLKVIWSACLQSELYKLF